MGKESKCMVLPKIFAPRARNLRFRCAVNALGLCCVDGADELNDKLVAAGFVKTKILNTETLRHREGHENGEE
jgi:hypothetical protein